MLTISAAHLKPEFLRVAGVKRERLADVIVQGVNPGGEFATAILSNHDTLNLERAGREVVEAVLALKARAPGLRTVWCLNAPTCRLVRKPLERVRPRLHRLRRAEP